MVTVRRQPVAPERSAGRLGTPAERRWAADPPPFSLRRSTRPVGSGSGGGRDTLGGGHSPSVSINSSWVSDSHVLLLVGGDLFEQGWPVVVSCFSGTWHYPAEPGAPCFDRRVADELFAECLAARSEPIP